MLEVSCSRNRETAALCKPQREADEGRCSRSGEVAVRLGTGRGDDLRRERRFSGPSDCTSTQTVAPSRVSIKITRHSARPAAACLACSACKRRDARRFFWVRFDHSFLGVNSEYGGFFPGNPYQPWDKRATYPANAGFVFALIRFVRCSLVAVVILAGTNDIAGDFGPMRFLSGER